MREIEVILRSLAVNAPVLNAWHVNLSRPLFLSIDAEDADKFIKGLSANPVVLSSSLKVTEARQKMSHTNSEAIVMRMPLKKLRDNIRVSMLIQELLDLAESSAKNALLVFVGNLQDQELSERTFPIHISDFQDTLDDVDVVPDPSDLKLVEDQISSQKVCDRDRTALYSAAAFCYPKLKYQRRLNDYRKLLSACDRLFDSWVCPIDDLSVVAISNRALFDAIRRAENDQNIIIDQDLSRIYLATDVFKKILGPVLEAVPYSEVKKKLAEAGILMTGPGFQLTHKVTFKTETGLSRKNLVVLDTSKITKTVDREEIRLCDYLK